MPWTKSKHPPQLKTDAMVRQAEAIRKKCVKDGGDEKECATRAIRIVLSRHKGGAMEKATEFMEGAKLSEIVENFQANVQGIDVQIDIAHDSNSGAVAWFRELEIRPSSKTSDKQALWGRVEWTDFGREVAGPDKKYKYISSSFGTYRDPETKAMYENVLFAATLTNRPLVKWMQPVDPKQDEWIELMREGDFYNKARWGDKAFVIETSEQNGFVQQVQNAVSDAVTRLFTERIDASPDANPLSKGVEMDESKFRKILATHKVELSEEATEEVILQGLTDLLDSKDKEIEGLETAAKTVAAEATAQLSEEKTKLADEKVNLSEQVTNLSTELAEQKQELSEVRKELADERKTVFFDEMINTGRIAPAERVDFEELYSASEDKVRKMLSERKPESVVKLSETGSASTQVDTLDDQDKFIQLAEQLVKDESITFAEATIRVATEHPELAGDE